MKKLIWDNRYSNTDEPDNMGRWARVGYLRHKSGDKFKECKIAWINKNNNILMAYVYIGQGEFKKDFETVEDAKAYCSDVVNEFYENYLKQ